MAARSRNAVKAVLIPQQKTNLMQDSPVAIRCYQAMQSSRFLSILKWLIAPYGKKDTNRYLLKLAKVLPRYGVAFS
jgi:hypothetical protein